MYGNTHHGHEPRLADSLRILRAELSKVLTSELENVPRLVQQNCAHEVVEHGLHLGVLVHVGGVVALYGELAGVEVGDFGGGHGEGGVVGGGGGVHVVKGGKGVGKGVADV